MAVGRVAGEGFLGGIFFTVLFAFVEPILAVQMPFLICPAESLDIFGFNTLYLTCDVPRVFVWQQYALPSAISWLGGSDGAVWLLPIQLHAIVLGGFASLVAPFGGFFASGIKRAFNLDDFGTWVPGHGGVFDRVDCQLIMGLATHTYYVTFIQEHTYTVGKLVQLAGSLAAADQVSLYRELGKVLKEQRLIR